MHDAIALPRRMPRDDVSVSVMTIAIQRSANWQVSAFLGTCRSTSTQKRNMSTTNCFSCIEELEDKVEGTSRRHPIHTHLCMDCVHDAFELAKQLEYKLEQFKMSYGVGITHLVTGPKQ